MYMYVCISGAYEILVEFLTSLLGSMLSIFEDSDSLVLQSAVGILIRARPFSPLLFNHLRTNRPRVPDV